MKTRQDSTKEIRLEIRGSRGKVSRVRISEREDGDKFHRIDGGWAEDRVTFKDWMHAHHHGVSSCGKRSAANLGKTFFPAPLEFVSVSAPLTYDVVRAFIEEEPTD